MEAVPHSPGRVELLATIAHELRNPLAAIQAAVRVLENQTAPDRNEARALIDRQVLRIARLSDDLNVRGQTAIDERLDLMGSVMSSRSVHPMCR